MQYDSIEPEILTEAEVCGECRFDSGLSTGESVDNGHQYKQVLTLRLPMRAYCWMSVTCARRLPSELLNSLRLPSPVVILLLTQLFQRLLTWIS